MHATRKAVMFANTQAGAARRLLYAVRSLQEAGIDCTVRFDLDREAIWRAVEDGRQQGATLVVAFGGDGTVGSVIDAIAGSGVVLGIIAAGTSNNFARSLGISPGVTSSVAAISDGKEITVDVGEINGHYFGHAAVMGLNVEFARQVQRLRGHIGRLSYPVASLAVYRSRQSLSIHVEGDSIFRDLETYQLTVLNWGNFPGIVSPGIRGGAAPAHQLRILAVQDLRLRRVVRDLPEISFRRHLGLPGSQAFCLTEGLITTPNPIPVTVDGEIKTHTPARVRVVPSSLHVLAPAELRPGRLVAEAVWATRARPTPDLTQNDPGRSESQVQDSPGSGKNQS